MSTEQLALEARALTARLYQAWDATEFDSPYATRLVAVAELAQRRHIRRAARHGDPLARGWLALMAKSAASPA
jgi:hypothetical protein